MFFEHAVMLLLKLLLPEFLAAQDEVGHFGDERAEHHVRASQAFGVAIVDSQEKPTLLTVHFDLSCELPQYRGELFLRNVAEILFP